MKLAFAFVLSIATTLACAHPGVGIVMDTKGNVYYTDLKQVWKIDAQGSKRVVVQSVHTHELYIDQQDNLYGEHLWYNGDATKTWGHYTWKLSPEGSLTKVIPDTEGFENKFSFVHDHAGHSFFVDRSKSCQKIARKTDQGEPNKFSDQCLNNIRWLTSGTNGAIYLLDLFDVKKIDPAGHVTTLATNIQTKEKEPNAVMGLCTDARENVYVAVYSERAVKKITPSGNVTVFAETGLIWSPSGTLAAPNGDFWILECSPLNAVRVERITKDQKRIIY